MIFLIIFEVFPLPKTRSWTFFARIPVSHAGYYFIWIGVRQNIPTFGHCFYPFCIPPDCYTWYREQISFLLLAPGICNNLVCILDQMDKINIINRGIINTFLQSFNFWYKFFFSRICLVRGWIGKTILTSDNALNARIMEMKLISISVFSALCIVNNT